MKHYLCVVAVTAVDDTVLTELKHSAPTDAVQVDLLEDTRAGMDIATPWHPKFFTMPLTRAKTVELVRD
jgi:hypothetical protein